MREMTPQGAFAVRVRVLWATRVIALVLGSVGAYLALKRLLFAAFSGMGTEMFTTWDGIGEEHSFYRGLAMMLVAGVLAACSTILARWAVPAIAYLCPGCGYEPPRTADPHRCPECGLDGAFNDRPAVERTDAR